MAATEQKVQLAIAAGIVRRYCDCGPTARPGGSQHWPQCRTCGLDRTRSGWTVAMLTELKALKRQLLSNKEIGEILGPSDRDVDIALNVLLSRTPVQALAVLERQAMRGFVMVRADDEAPLQKVGS